VIRAGVMDDLGENDACYIRRVIAVQRGLEAGGRALLLVSLFPPAFVGGTAALSAAKILENMEIGHNVLHVARTMSTLDYGDAHGWRRAIEGWNTAVAARKDVAAKLADAEADASQARRELDAAIARNNLAEPKVRRGEQARTTLLTKIRSRISEAARDDLLFPAWFENALGPGAPATNTKSWLDTASEVVAYRLVNGIDDQLLVLGQRPTTSGWQQDEHDNLASAYRRLRS
jgi:hypothetical protein